MSWVSLITRYFGFFFFRTANVSNGTLCSVHGLVGMHSVVAFTWALTKFSYTSFGVFLISEEYRICFLLFIANISVAK